MTTIQIPIRELHARTGHYVRQAAANTRVIITDHGKPIAQLQPLQIQENEATPPSQTSAAEESAESFRPRWQNRILLPGYAKIMNVPIGGTDSTQIISEDRNRGNDW